MTDRESEIQEQREHQHHQTNLARPAADDDNAPETLQYISEPEDVDAPLDALEWANSKSASTANFTEDDVRSKEWVLEYFQLIHQLRGVRRQRELAGFQREGEVIDECLFP